MATFKVALEVNMYPEDKRGMVGYCMRGSVPTGEAGNSGRNPSGHIVWPEPSQLDVRGLGNETGSALTS